MTNETPSLLPLTAFPEWDDDGRAATDATGCTWGSPVEALTMGVLGLCGCGYAEQRDEDILDVLNAVRVRWDTTEEAKGRLTIPDRIGTMYGELILNVLDTAGLVEHGTSIGGAWITDLGRQWLDAINEHTPTID